MQSLLARSLFTRVHLHLLLARFAFDVATPVELAVAPLRDARLKGVVAPSAAHQLAPVHAGRVPIAAPPDGTHGARAAVGAAVVRTLVQIHQVVLRGFVEAPIGLHQTRALAVELHLGGAVVLRLQRVARGAEVRQLVPAGLQRAAAAHAVALAGHVGARMHHLQKETTF